MKQLKKIRLRFVIRFFLDLNDMISKKKYKFNFYIDDRYYRVSYDYNAEINEFTLNAMYLKAVDSKMY